MDNPHQVLALDYESRPPPTPSVFDSLKATGRVDLVGLIIGAVCYLIGEALTPRHVETPSQHDRLLAVRLGFIYTPVVGLWLGWIQRSWRRAFFGAAVGTLIGLAYMWLCATGNFLAIMVGFPCLLGGVLSAITGSKRSDWGPDFGKRLAKGLLAGLIFGLIYMVVLNVAAAMILPIYPISSAQYTKSYIAMIWRAGPVALGVASGLFFVAIRWAVGVRSA